MIRIRDSCLLCWKVGNKILTVVLSHCLNFCRRNSRYGGIWYPVSANCVNSQVAHFHFAILIGEPFYVFPCCSFHCPSTSSSLFQVVAIPLSHQLLFRLYLSYRPLSRGGKVSSVTRPSSYNFLSTINLAYFKQTYTFGTSLNEAYLQLQCDVSFLPQDIFTSPRNNEHFIGYLILLYYTQ